LTFRVDAEGMQSPKNALSLVPAIEHPKVDVEVETGPVRLTGEAAKRAERANLLALEAEIEAACGG
jgi:hypothetical protein